MALQSLTPRQRVKLALSHREPDWVRWIFWILILPLLLNACGGLAPATALPNVVFVTVASATNTPLPPSPSATPIATVIASTEPVAVVSPTPEPTPTLEPTFTPEPDWLTNVGRTADNLVYLGNPNAPITLIDFSDFM